MSIIMIYIFTNVCFCEAEYTECSHHGTCVRETGRCDCSFGFRGEACDDISDSDDAQVNTIYEVLTVADSVHVRWFA